MCCRSHLLFAGVFVLLAGAVNLAKDVAPDGETAEIPPLILQQERSVNSKRPQKHIDADPESIVGDLQGAQVSESQITLPEPLNTEEKKALVIKRKSGWFWDNDKEENNFNLPSSIDQSLLAESVPSAAPPAVEDPVSVLSLNETEVEVQITPNISVSRKRPQGNVINAVKHSLESATFVTSDLSAAADPVNVSRISHGVEAAVAPTDAVKAEEKNFLLVGSNETFRKADDEETVEKELQMAPENRTLDGLEFSLGDPGNPERWAVMHRGGVPSSQFKCGMPSAARAFVVSSLQASSTILVSDEHIDKSDLDDSEDDMWGLKRPFQLFGGGAVEDADSDVLIQLKNFVIETQMVNSETSEFLNETASSLLDIYTSPLIESNELILSTNDNLELVYVCKGQGTAEVKIRASGTSGSPYCFSWIKRCNPTWEGFQILETGWGRTVSEDGKTMSEWQMNPDGGNAVSFMLTHPGSEGSIRLKGASVSSNNPNFGVTLRGSLDTIVNETVAVSNIVSIAADTAEQIDVVYQCANEKIEDAQVTLLLYNEAPALAPLSISWAARCSGQSLLDMSATMTSCKAKKNTHSLAQTQAMSQGQVAPELQEGSLTVAADDDCTALLFTANNSDSVIDLFPSHQLVYDRKVLLVANKVGSVETTVTGDPLLRFPYICVGDGVTDVSLTVHFKNRSSADFNWKKACRQPSVHTSRMITGHHIFALLMALFLTSFLLCFISRSRTLTQFILRKLRDCCPWCCRWRAAASDERTQFTAFGVAV
eukprot:Gregarina_sp_Poly_1__10921@NODE_855_length_5952_cov_168_906542_g618_i0_p1_GENE_NODE_855_length_5952_cov_168_906542_g618_i0NODE_855_length_5952_cov_168_906542_g618_i0_p1_ORF_typecomplete_len769_score105_21_NODE_855_length_5952_cov_168_906542_g618_i035585864